MAEPIVVTPPEFARRVGLSRSYVGELLRAGQLYGATQTASGRWRIPIEAVERYLAGERGGNPQHATSAGEAPVTPRSSPRKPRKLRQWELTVVVNPAAPPVDLDAFLDLYIHVLEMAARPELSEL